MLVFLPLRRRVSRDDWPNERSTSHPAYSDKDCILRNADAGNVQSRKTLSNKKCYYDATFKDAITDDSGDVLKVTFAAFREYLRVGEYICMIAQACEWTDSRGEEELIMDRTASPYAIAVLALNPRNRYFLQPNTTFNSEIIRDFANLLCMVGTGSGTGIAGTHIPSVKDTLYSRWLPLVSLACTVIGDWRVPSFLSGIPDHELKGYLDRKELVRFESAMAAYRPLGCVYPHSRKDGC